jgi:hypothetical protein
MLEVAGRVPLRLMFQFRRSNPSRLWSLVSAFGDLVSHPQETCAGADVSHASPGSFFPSVAGLVGSLDLNFVKYVARCSPQPARYALFYLFYTRCIC